MLNGIGGRTVAEAKEVMTMAEARRWAAYRTKRGSLNPSLRLEEGIARVLGAIYTAAGSKDVNIEQFMPHVVDPPEKHDDDHLATPEDAMRILQSVATSSKAEARRDALIARQRAKRVARG